MLSRLFSKMRALSFDLITLVSGPMPWIWCHQPT